MGNDLKKRLIPCLDVKDGRTVKGINFVGLRDAGDPIELAYKYAQEGADELVFLDISATHEKRKTMLQWVEEVAKEVNIPFTVGGGISSVDDVYQILRAGADKVSINSSAIRNPQLLTAIANKFGNQCVVCAIDAKQEQDHWSVYVSGGRTKTELELFAWAKEAESLGAGEILFTSMNQDGTKEGFALEALSKMNEQLSIPVIASGGAGSMSHFKDVFTLGKADAALAASIFHFGEVSLPDLKSYLWDNQIKTRQIWN